ncbi:F-box protein PP2-B1, partial [Trifolium medium]|nr:F-box protein PP2-B1 [Trifolium medium]
FLEVAELLGVCWFHIRGMINMRALSPKTHYAAYLVFKITGAFGLNRQNFPVELSIGVEGGHSSSKTVHLDPNVEGKQRPSVRSDGW